MWVEINKATCPTQILTKNAVLIHNEILPTQEMHQ